MNNNYLHQVSSKRHDLYSIRVLFHVNVKVINNETKFTSKYNSNQILKINIAHNEGNYFTNRSHLEQLKTENLIWESQESKFLQVIY